MTHDPVITSSEFTFASVATPGQVLITHPKNWADTPHFMPRRDLLEYAITELSPTIGSKMASELLELLRKGAL